MPQSKRRKGPLGTRVLVCGQPVSKAHDLICLLPTSIPHHTHVAIGVGENNVLVLVYRETGKKEIEWQPVETNQNGRSTSSQQP